MYCMKFVAKLTLNERSKSQKLLPGNCGHSIFVVIVAFVIERARVCVCSGLHSTVVLHSMETLIRQRPAQIHNEYGSHSLLRFSIIYLFFSSISLAG